MLDSKHLLFAMVSFFERFNRQYSDMNLNFVGQKNPFKTHYDVTVAHQAARQETRSPSDRHIVIIVNMQV